MDPVAREQVALVVGTGLGDGGLHVGVQVGQPALLLLGQVAQEGVVRGELLVVGVGRILADHGGRQDHHLHAGRLTLLHNFSDVLFVGLQRDAVGPVPHIVDAAAQGHPVGFLAQDITIQALEHLVGLVTADARRDGTHPKAVGLEASDHQRHIALGLDAGLGDGVSHEADLLAVLEGDARRLDGCGDHGHRKQEG